MARSVHAFYGDSDRRCRSAPDRRERAATAMSLPEPFRYEVWDVDLDTFRLHPAVVLSINPPNVQLRHVA